MRIWEVNVVQITRSNNWTETELRKLRVYADGGCSAYQIAAALNRSVANVRAMAARRGITIPNFNERDKRPSGEKAART